MVYSSSSGSPLSHTGTLVSHVTLRLLKPECVLDKSWCQEELPVAVQRAVALLHSNTIPARAGKSEPGKQNTCLGTAWPWSLPLEKRLNHMEDFELSQLF